uniref:NADH:ubiquinone reductase (H(+)-translocating) n=1 Tax=Platygaster sp. ZJUH_2016029 TaxID=2496284 RepID=A0A3Q8UAE5_9HYME|nr:NADH dehydrogenase subunit 5 [Platygaster sp. ZJUH_2016029]
MYMYMYMNVGLLFFYKSIICLIFMIYFLLFKLKIFMEIELNMMNSMKNSLIIYLDYKSFMFLMIVMLISSMILIYSVEYMLMDLFKIRFLFLLSMFVMSMLFMIIGQNLLMILFGWDGLGLISYCLVIYYNSWVSYNAGMLTILSNRLGDIGLLISIGMFSFFGSWNYLFYTFFNLKIVFMMLLAFITKSAQIPFSSWLPAAMAAPTPISSLVHSSTLVTAGIYLLLRFYNILFLNLNFMNLLLFMGVLTMFMSGLMASFENDFKKIIALSTLSQLGLMMMSLCMGLKLLMFFHLIIHALFKSLLFMCAGLILHSMIDNQDIRFMGSLNLNYYLTLMYFNCANLALIGFPFMAGFFSKDMILEKMLMLNSNLFLMLMFYFSIMLTVIYSFRLLFFINTMFLKFFNYSQMYDNKLMNKSMLILFISSIFMGMLLSDIIFLNLSLMILSFLMKLLILQLIIISMFIGGMMNFLKIKWNIILMYLNLMYFMKKMFGLIILFNYFFKMFNLSLNLYLYMEKGWIKFYSVIQFKYMFESLLFYYYYYYFIWIMNLMILLMI